MYVDNIEREQFRETGICLRCGAGQNEDYAQCQTCGKPYPATIWKQEKEEKITTN